MAPQIILQDPRRRFGNGGRARARPPFFATKQVAIIGATDSVVDAPWHDPRWTIVTHTCSRQFCEREPDWYFDMHPPSCFRTERKGWNKSYYSWLKALQTPIFMQKAWPEIPMAVEYPIHRILAEFRGFFTNHAAFMMALAMTEGVQKIGLFGCEYAIGKERAVQRDSLMYWLGRAEQAGVELVLPVRKTTLLRPHELYGYESHDKHGKLTGPYAVKAEKEQIEVEKGNGQREVRDLMPLRVDGVKLPRPPDGEDVAWDRAEQFYGITKNDVAVN